jgi:4-amino-4-deoxy-L-arabinose transferase-like glycosyltransferase
MCDLGNDARSVQQSTLARRHRADHAGGGGTKRVADSDARRIKFAPMSSVTSSAATSTPVAEAAAPAPSRDDARRFRIYAAAVLAAAAILFFVRLGSRALWSSEFRWAEVAREMSLTHDYFWPTINGRVYFDKPLGTYWLVLGASGLTGHVDETAARLPCAIAGLLGVALLMLLVRRLYEWKSAALAGFIIATSYSYVFFSRHASADVETVTGEIAALLLFLKYEDAPDGWWVIGLWLIMAVTSQTKGLLGFALPLVVIGTYACLSDGWRALGDGVLRGTLAQRVRWLIERNRWLFNWKSVVAIALAAAIYYAPFAMSAGRTGSEKGLAMVWRENVVRFFHPFDHRGPIYLYFYVIFALMAPWSALLPAALVETHARRRTGADLARADRFALVWFWAVFIFFTLSGSRRSYYILPILPAGAVLVARLVSGPAEIRSRWAHRLMIAGYAIVAAAAVLSLGMLLPASWLLRGTHFASLPPAPAPAAVAVLWVIMIGGIVYALRNFSAARAGVSMCVIAGAFSAYIFVFAMPAADAYRGEKPFGLEVVQKLAGKTDNLALYKTLGPLFYLNPPRPLPEYESEQDLLNAIQHDHIRWFIARRRDVPRRGIPMKLEAAEASFPWENIEELRNKVVLLRVGGGS